MNRSFLARVMALLAMLLLTTPARSAELQKADDDAIRAQARDFAAAYDRGDAKAIAALWTADGDYEVGGSSVSGRDAIAQLYDDHFKTHPGSK